MKNKCDCKEKFNQEFGFYKLKTKLICMQCDGTLMDEERLRKIKEYNTPHNK